MTYVFLDARHLTRRWMMVACKYVSDRRERVPTEQKGGSRSGNNDDNSYVCPWFSLDGCRQKREKANFFLNPCATTTTIRMKMTKISMNHRKTSRMVTFLMSSIACIYCCSCKPTLFLRCSIVAHILYLRIKKTQSRER